MWTEKLPQEMTVDDLNRLYTEGEECDKRLFAEMRTNLQLVAGEHYVREGSKFWNRIRNDRQLTNEQRLKLTKNHIQRVTKIYRNEIESASPGVQIIAANESELSDQKAAELNDAYWQYLVECENLHDKRAIWAKNYVEIGEVCVKVFWDQQAGNKIGVEPAMVEDAEGNMVEQRDEMGNVLASDKPVYGGTVKFETFEGYNVRRDKDARTMEESPYIILSKLVPNKRLRTHIKDEVTLRKFDAAPLNEFTVYDNNTGMYKSSSGQSLVKEAYWRPSPLLPNGYYQIYTDTVVLSEGELPYGIFPVIHEGFDDQTGNPRSHSIIRHLRPAQVEINRAASKMAEHQITLGDDKVWVPATAKVNQGAMLPGIRVNTYTGMKPPEITAGRAGDQYLGYMESQVNELYKLAHLPEYVEDKPQSQDLYTNLFESYKHKKKFSVYGQKFERFLIRVAKTALEIAKKSISDHDFIQAVGKNEYINIPEFKNTKELQYQIRVKPQSDDIESQFGKQLTLNHMIQYIGPNLDKEDIGQMLRLSPFVNEDLMFKKFTQRYDRLVNDILALDRGEPRPIRKYDDHKYIIQGLAARMSEPDFEHLSPQVQELYNETIALHEQAEAQALLEMQRAQSGFIPSGGYLVACDFYVPDPKNPQSSKRLRLPSEAISWLIDKLKTQGTNFEKLLNMPVGVGQDIGRMLSGMGAGEQAQPPGLPMPPGNMGAMNVA
jgi:hypothetical protein